MTIDKSEKIDEIHKELELKGYVNRFKVLKYPSEDFKGYSYIKIYNKKANKENMIDEIRKMINVDKIIRFETTQESTGVIIGKNDSNEMVKNLKKIYEPYFWEKQ